MTYIGKEANKKLLKKQIKEAEEFFALKFQKLRKEMTMDNITEYNNASHQLGILRMKLKFAEKTEKPQQYMEELNIPGNINL